MEGEQGDWTSTWLLLLERCPESHEEIDVRIHPDVRGAELISLGSNQCRLEMRSSAHPLDPEGYPAVDAVLTSIHNRYAILEINGSLRSKWRTFRDESPSVDG